MWNPRSAGKRHATDSAASDRISRGTGIRALSSMPWGTHICVFYETKQDLLDTATAYFEAGLKSNEFCVWAISDPITWEDAVNALREVVSDFDQRLEAGQIEIIPGTEWYLPGGEFDLQQITGGWRVKLATALAKGYDGMRVSGNAFWIGTSHWKEFCEYEYELDESLAGQRMIVLCTYSLSASRCVDLLEVARAHELTIVRRNGEWEFLATPEFKPGRSSWAKRSA